MTPMVVDSCACGLRVVPQLMERLRAPRVVYFADYANNPLGVKSVEDISMIARTWHEMASCWSLGGIVVACNTASVVLHTDRRASASSACPQATMVDAFRAMVLASALHIRGRRVHLLGTRATTRDPTFKAILSEAGAYTVTTFSATITESVVASGRHRSPAGVAEAERELKRAAEVPCDTVILGCTCFGYLRRAFEAAFGGRARLLDPLDYLPGAVAPLGQDAPGTPRGASVDLLSSGTQAQFHILRAFAEEVFPRAMSMTPTQGEGPTFALRLELP